MLIKICGITNVDDALAAVDAGANALGFVLHPASPRAVSAQAASGIIARLPERILNVAVIVAGDQLPEEGLWAAVQVHGATSDADLPRFRGRMFVAQPSHTWQLFPSRELIIDESRGQGRRADWAALRAVERPFILSGGLTPDNVAGAVRLLRPVGVDVSSGVETAPGRKDHAKIRAFVYSAKQACQDAGAAPKAELNQE